MNREEIKVKEWELLTTLNFNVNIMTHLEYLDRLIYKNFQEDNNNTLKIIKDTSIYILKMCLHDYKFLNYKPKTLALAALLYCIKCYFYSLQADPKKPVIPAEMASQENILVILFLIGIFTNYIRSRELLNHVERSI